MRYLEQYYDSALDVEGLLHDTLEEEECDRLQDQLETALVAVQIPRRLSMANREELALDKKRCRRIAHILRQSLSAWGGKEPEREISPETRQRGAQVDWPSWWAEHEPWLLARRRLYATWAKDTSNMTLGKRYITRVTNELEWLQYAMRD